MANGVLFSTGNNVQEIAVPLMLLVEAGFDFDVATPTGKPPILDECSSPRKDEAVPGFIRDNQTKFEQPVSLAKLVAEAGLSEAYPYAAVFLPRGHGTMVGLPQDKDVGELIRWMARSDRYLVTAPAPRAPPRAAPVPVALPTPATTPAAATTPRPRRQGPIAANQTPR